MCKLGGRPCPNLSQLNRIIGRPSYFDACSHHYKLVRIILERDGMVYSGTHCTGKGATATGSANARLPVGSSVQIVSECRSANTLLYSREPLGSRAGWDQW